MRLRGARIDTVPLMSGLPESGDKGPIARTSRLGFRIVLGALPARCLACTASEPVDCRDRKERRNDTRTQQWTGGWAKRGTSAISTICVTEERCREVDTYG